MISVIISVMWRKGRTAAGTVAAALMLAASPAVADVATFNEAMRAGDLQKAAAAAESAWEDWDNDHPSTALIAREFGFAALMAGRNDLAARFGRFLAEQGRELAEPDDHPLTSAVLWRAAEFRIRADAPERDALEAALRARMELPGADMISVVASELLYEADWSSSRWAEATVTASLAAELMAREADALLSSLRLAELHAASADFLRVRHRPATASRNATYDALVALHDDIVADIDDPANEAIRDALWSLLWQAHAWAYSAETYFRSTTERTGSLVSVAPRRRQLTSPGVPQIADEADRRPMCDGTFEGSAITYPRSNLMKGMVGTVIVRLQTDAEGHVVSKDVLAAVPLEGFADAVTAAMADWRWKPAPDVDRSGCRLDTRNKVQVVAFTIR